jgi:hypothetical protein
MSDNTDDQHFVRYDLLNWLPDGRRQTAAWDRLRRVCLELGLRVPTRADVHAADQDLGALHADFTQGWNLMDEEASGVVICARADDGVALLCQFSAGYIFEVAPGDDQAPEGTTV